MRTGCRVALVLAALLGCSDSGGSKTRIVLAIGSDYAVPSELDSVSVLVTVSGKSSSRDISLTGNETGKDKLPVYLDIVPPSNNQAERFEVKVTGKRNGQLVVTQEAQLSFLAGESRVLTIFLGHACSGVACQANFTCSAGQCQPVQIVTSTLPTYDPNHLPPPSAPDGGAIGIDGGAIDGLHGGVDGVTTVDSGAIDGVTDVAIADASLDQPLSSPTTDAELVFLDAGIAPVGGAGGTTSTGSGGSGSGGAGGATGSGGLTGTAATGLVGGLVTVGDPVLKSSSGVRLVEHGLEFTPTVCGQIGGKTVCVSGGIRP